MDSPEWIAAKGDQPEPLSFDDLVQNGLHLVQDAAGKLWSDYNTHDPGVTILEQLSYALTDLKHRSEHAAGDYLCDDYGRLSEDTLALYRPERILPSTPVTATDLKKRLLDGLPDVQKVTINFFESGLLEVVVYPAKTQVSQSADPYAEGAGPAADTLPAQVLTIFESQRLLGEDLLHVRVVPMIACDLVVSLQVDREARPERVVTEVLERCNEILVAEPEPTPYDQLIGYDKRPIQALDDLLEGPLLRRGLIREDAMRGDPELPTSDDFYSAFTTIQGVLEAWDLKFIATESLLIGDIQYNAGGEVALDDRYVIALNPPAPNQIQLFTMPSREFANDQVVPYKLQEVNDRLEQALQARQSGREVRSSPSQLRTPVEAEQISRRGFYSVQHDFPATYGLGRHGLTSTATNRQRIENLQFKGYLLLFDQLMANFTADLGALRELYSIDLTEQRTYRTRVFGTDEIRDVEQIYPINAQAETILAATMTRHDPYLDRKNRILDYLLAMYGEEMIETGYLQFAPKLPLSLLRQRLLLLKTRFLRHIVELSAGRASNAEGTTNLARRVSMKLGLSDPASPCGEWIGRGRDVENPTDLPDHDVIMDPDIYAASDVPLFAAETVSQILQNCVSSLAPNAMDNVYALGVARSEGAFHLYLLSERGRGWVLGNFPDTLDADRVAAWLYHDLRQADEYIRVVEHISLRPINSPDEQRVAVQQAREFYNLQVTVITPDWTARMKQPAYWPLLRDTIVDECPAHLSVRFVCMNESDLTELERTLARWRDARAAYVAAPFGNHETLNFEAGEVRRLIQTRGRVL